MSGEANYLWESDALVSATRGRPVGKLPEGITGISIDTRTLKPGEAYFAIKGDVHDGHDFVSAAMKAGAAMAIVAEEKLVALGGYKIPLVVVSDVLEAMRQLGMAARARTKAQIIAITGSVGKTTTKEMMRTVLSASGPVHASAASFNNHWGVPLTLARMPVETRFGIFEIGMNHPDEIRPLVKMVRPHIAMITNVGAAHLGAFDSIDGIAHAKAEIFEGLVAGGYGIINKDDKRAKLQSELATAAGVEHLLTYGKARGSDFRLVSAEPQDGRTQFAVTLRGKSQKGVINLQGDHFLANAVLVLGVADLAGADLEKSVAAVAEIEPEKGRGKRHTLLKNKAKFTLIDDSYNANPSSMRAALQVLGNSKPGSRGQRIAILGDMLELGNASPDLHRDLAGPISENDVDKVYTVGSEIEVLSAELEKKTFAGHFKTWKAALGELTKSLRHGDVIMVKASNGLRFADLVEALCDKYSVTKKAKEKPKRLGSR